MRPIVVAIAAVVLLGLLAAPPAAAALDSPAAAPDGHFAGPPADWVWPVVGRVITPFRNGGDPYAGGQHRGIDIGARVGTTVVAAAAGSVTFSGLAGSSGLT